jgi:hypothetical protein
MPRKGAPAPTDADDRFDDSRPPRRTLASNGKQASVIWAGVRGGPRAWRTCAFCECARQHVGAGWTVAALASAQKHAQGTATGGDCFYRRSAAQRSCALATKRNAGKRWWRPTRKQALSGAVGISSAFTAEQDATRERWASVSKQASSAREVPWRGRRATSQADPVARPPDLASARLADTAATAPKWAAEGASVPRDPASMGTVTPVIRRRREIGGDGLHHRVRSVGRPPDDVSAGSTPRAPGSRWLGGVGCEGVPGTGNKRGSQRGHGGAKGHRVELVELERPPRRLRLLACPGEELGAVLAADGCGARSRGRSRGVRGRAR